MSRVSIWWSSPFSQGDCLFPYRCSKRRGMTCKDVVVDRLRRGLRGRSQTRLIDANHDGGCQTVHSRNRLVIAERLCFVDVFGSSLRSATTWFCFLKKYNNPQSHSNVKCTLMLPDSKVLPCRAMAFCVMSNEYSCCF